MKLFLKNFVWINKSNLIIGNPKIFNKGFELAYENMSYLHPMGYIQDRYNKLTGKMFPNI
jgi:hypothetical protein